MKKTNYLTRLLFLVLFIPCTIIFLGLTVIVGIIDLFIYTPSYYVKHKEIPSDEKCLCRKFVIGANKLVRTVNSFIESY